MHGNSGNIGLRIPFYELITSTMEVNILSMAYRGYSYSDKVVVNEVGLKMDVEAIVEFIRDTGSMDAEIAAAINPQLIFAHGRSLGGAAAIYMSSIAPDLFRGLIIENTFLSISAMVDKMFPFLIPIKQYVLKIGWHNDEIVPDLRLPIFYVTGDADELVPYEHTLKLHGDSRLAIFKELLVVEGGTHNDSWYVGGRNYVQMLKDFLKRCTMEYLPPKFDEWAGGTQTETLKSQQ